MTIADVVAREVVRSADRADLERRARRTLHTTAALYLLRSRPSVLLRKVEDIGLDDAASRRWCRTVLSRHFSSAERLMDLDRFYPTLLDLTGPVREVADLACALNTLTVPWLRDATDCRYVGYDFNRFYVELGTRFLTPRFPGCTVEHCDVLLESQRISADVALLLKTYHCLENRCEGAGFQLLEGLQVSQVVVSFPLRAMSGRHVGFAQRNVRRLIDLADERSWTVRSAKLSGEELLVIRKDDGRT